MAEVTHRSFDLKSWQGLTEVLKVARESNLSPTDYAEFRNLVLKYAQEKGTDEGLKKQIDSIIAKFGVAREKSARENETTQKTSENEMHGRRVVPSFTPRARVAHVPQSDTREEHKEKETQSIPASHESPIVPPPPPAPREEEVVQLKETVPEPPSHLAPPPVAEEESPERGHAPLKSVEEHRMRIMEIKRQVNSHVKNPVMLVDGDNHLGKAYMSALLRALKATSPGGTFDLEPAMEELEDNFKNILAFIAQPQSTKKEETALEAPAPVAEVPQSPMLSDFEKKPAPDIQVVPPTEEPAPSQVGFSVLPAEVAEEKKVESAHMKEEVESKPEEEVSKADTPNEDDKRWSEEGGDVPVREQIRALREKLGETKAGPHDVRPAHKAFIPSLIDIEDTVVPPPQAEVRGTAWDPHGTSKKPGVLLADLTERPGADTTGITLGTPQAELMTPEVTMALTELLHEWKIFASSGIFGMGPGGIEHPLYVRLARLPMGEVLSGRFDDANMKTVKIIKDYVDAWRHEQGISYNPTETFEHYLRRVAQRIMKRRVLP